MRLFFRALDADARALAAVTVAAIGPGTAADASGTAYAPTRALRGRGLLDALAGMELTACSSRARPRRATCFPTACAMARVEVLALYDTVPEPLSAAQLEELARASRVTFTSSSTVRYFLDGGGRIDGQRVVSIGPVTSATLRERGIEPHVEAERRSRRPRVGADRGRDGVIVTLLTDYGRDDDFVGVCRGDPRHPPRCPDRGRDPRDPRFGAPGRACAAQLPYMPVGVHVAVVDPQVGSERRAVALRTGDGRILVGPDNGLLSLAWESCGGVQIAVDITLAASARARVGHLPRTRHLRSVAAHLAAGPSWPTPATRSTSLAVDLPSPRLDDGALVAHALVVDRFGNVGLDVGHEGLAGTGITLGGTVEIEAAGELYLATFAQTFADVPGELIVYEDAYRTLAVAINRGDAAGTLRLEPDSEVRLRPR